MILETSQQSQLKIITAFNEKLTFDYNSVLQFMHIIIMYPG